MSSKREAEETLKVLRQLEATRDAQYVWTRDELAQVAPFYHGPPKRFNITQYIQLYTRRTAALNAEPPSSNSRANIIEQQAMSINEAVRKLFHSICPHPVRYYDEEGQIDFEKYNADLGLWMTTVSTTWVQMQDTRHDSDCGCCISFKRLATNYEDMFKKVLTSEEYNEKRVSRNTIIRWASGLSSEGAKEGLESLISVGKALLSGQESSMVSDLIDQSSELSDAGEDEPSILTYVPETVKAEMRYDEVIEPEIEQEVKVMRRRKVARRPLDTVVEISDEGGMLQLAITELGVMVHVKIPHKVYTSIGRNEICEYAKVFFIQLVKVKSSLAVLDMLNQRAKTRRVIQMHKAYQTVEKNLRASLSGERAVYTTRSRKKRRKLMLHGDDK